MDASHVRESPEELSKSRDLRARCCIGDPIRAAHVATKPHSVGLTIDGIKFSGSEGSAVKRSHSLE